MSSKRRKYSFDLAPYIEPCRGFNEPKYNFSASRVTRRKRKYIPVPCVDANSADATTAQSFCEEDVLSIAPSTEELGEEDNVSQLSGTMGSENTNNKVDFCCFNPSERIPLDDSKMYSLLLQENKAISFCNYSSSAFVLQDVNLLSGKLKANSYVFVERRGLQFSDVTELVYWCSCNPELSTFMSTLAVNISTSFKEFQSPKCIHIEACKLLVKGHDMAVCTSPEDFLHDPLTLTFTTQPDSEGETDSIFPLHDGSSICLFDWTRNYAVLTVGRNNLLCTRCRYDCEHVSTLLSLKQSDYPSCLDTIFLKLDSLATGRSAPLLPLQGVSRKPVSFELDEDLQRIFRQGGIQNCLPLSDKQELPLKCALDSSQCSTCLCDWTLESKNMNFFTETTTVLAKVTSAKCPMCDDVVEYDGGSHLVLNMKSCLVSHDMLRSYMHLFLNGRFPMHTYYKVLAGKHADSGDYLFEAQFPYYMFRASWYKYVSLLSIDFAVGFTCPKCGSEPTTIICDATSLSFRRQLLEFQEADTEYGMDILTGSSVNERVFIPDQKCRLMLTRYAKTAEDNESLRSFSDSDCEELFRLLNLYSHPLLVLIRSFGASVPCSSAFAPLLKSLASLSPVCALICPTSDVLDLLDKVASGYEIRSDPTLWYKLQTSIPILYKLLVDLNQNAIPSTLRPVLLQMKTIALLPFERTKPEVYSLVDMMKKDECCYFPNIPLRRKRGVYKADNSGKELSCNKKYRGHPALLPGIFTLFCSHGVCVGFQVMESFESPNVPFTIMKTRFNRAPAIVVYDNSCSLHTYCLRRDPHFFKYTRFLVDRFHWKNHTGCSAAYNLDSYPDLSGLNSEVNEQANASLSKLKSQLSYMNQHNFMVHCKLYLWNRNRLKRRTIL